MNAWIEIMPGVYTSTPTRPTVHPHAVVILPGVTVPAWLLRYGRTTRRRGARGHIAGRWLVDAARLTF